MEFISSAVSIANTVSSFVIVHRLWNRLDKFTELMTPNAVGVRNNGFICPHEDLLLSPRSKILLELPLIDLGDLNAWFQLLSFVQHHVDTLEFSSTGTFFAVCKILGVNACQLRLPFIEVRSGVPRLIVRSSSEIRILIQSDDWLWFLNTLVQIALFGFPVTKENLQTMEWGPEILFYLRARLFQGYYDRYTMNVDYGQNNTSLFMSGNQFTKVPFGLIHSMESIASARSSEQLQQRLNEIHQMSNHIHYLGDQTESMQVLNEKDMIQGTHEYKEYLKRKTTQDKVGPVLFANISRFKLPCQSLPEEIEQKLIQSGDWFVSNKNYSF